MISVADVWVTADLDSSTTSAFTFSLSLLWTVWAVSMVIQSLPLSVIVCHPILPPCFTFVCACVCVCVCVWEREREKEREKEAFSFHLLSWAGCFAMEAGHSENTDTWTAPANACIFVYLLNNFQSLYINSEPSSSRKLLRGLLMSHSHSVKYWGATIPKHQCLTSWEQDSKMNLSHE